MKIKKLISDLLRYFRKTTEYRQVLFLNENPEKRVPGKTLVVISSGGKPKWLRFRCPCGCGDELVLPLMTNYNPHWEITQHPDKTLTVIPSVNVTRQCGAHFFIKGNKVTNV